MASPAPASISISSVSKSFGPVRANRDATLEVTRGEIHALVGENGAGKSTLMRIISGMFTPDSGQILVEGRDVTGWSTAEAIAAGVGMVHQHFMLVPTLTVAENVVLGRELTRGIVLDRVRAEREVQELSERTGLSVDPAARVSQLSVGEAQRVEILKVLYRGARILILDEPTAVLSPPEVQEFWKVLRRLRDGGDTIVLITHKLDEVIEISDTITVMRAGATVGRLTTRDATPASIAKMMVGRDVALALDVGITGQPSAAGAQPAAPPARGAAATTGAPALVVQDLVVASSRRAREVDGLSFTIAAGEVLGIAGVEGNGQTELIEAITGLRAPAAGSIQMATVSGGTIDTTRCSVRERTSAGLAHIPEDRHRRGLVLDYTIAHNLVLGMQGRFSTRGVLDAQAIAANAERQIAQFDIRPANPQLPARALSGGNQQKIVIAREMGGGGGRDYTVLVAAQPTRGVDVGAIEFIHGQIREARARGKAVLLISADLVEVLALADRVAVMYAGQFPLVVSRAEATPEMLGHYMTGASKTGEYAA
jgi:general nucleoside transport system ATP-binding protein